MLESTTREKILKKVRSALIEKSNNPYRNINFDSPVYVPDTDVPELLFAQRLSETGGNFIFCENKSEFAVLLSQLAKQQKWPTMFCSEKILSGFLTNERIPNSSDFATWNKEVCITGCEYLIA